MSEITKNPRDFVGYEYKKLTVPRDKLPLFLDAYQNFGWEEDPHIPRRAERGETGVTLKRDRRILNKAELTRLQRNFEACAEEIQALEHSKTQFPAILALVVGLVGTALMACSVFAVVSEPPRILACVLFAIPAFAGWILPPFLYRSQVHRKTKALTPLIEEKYEEIYRLCQRGHQLLPRP